MRRFSALFSRVRFTCLVIAGSCIVSARCEAQVPTRTAPAAGKLLPMRVRVIGLPTDAPLVRLTVLVEATGEQIPRSMPAGVLRSLLVPAGLITLSGDTVLVQRDSSGPQIFVPVETGQLTMPDSGVAVVRYAPITGTAEVRFEGGPPGLSAGAMLFHRCTESQGCPEGRSLGMTYTGAGSGDVVGIASSVLRVAPALPGIWGVKTWSPPTDADGASLWCASPTATNFTVEPGRHAIITVRFVKRRACQ